MSKRQSKTTQPIYVSKYIYVVNGLRESKVIMNSLFKRHAVYVNDTWIL